MRGEPNGEPTTTDTRPRQATSSHDHRCSIAHRATSSHVKRPYFLVLQARGRRFEPCCAHCFSELEMIVREPNGEPQLLMILAMAGLCEASRGAGTPHSPASCPPAAVPCRDFRPSLSHPGPDAKPAETSAASRQAGVED